MPWVTPMIVLGGHHDHAEGLHIGKLFGAIRAQFTSDCDFRIILNDRPYHAIAFEATEQPILQRWSEIEPLVDRLATMKNDAWYPYMMYYATQRAKGESGTPSEQEPLSPDGAAASTSAVPQQQSPQQQQQQQQPPSVVQAPLGSLCKVCMEREADMVATPCGHEALCGQCTTDHKWETCPICRTPVASFIKVFKT